MKGFAKLGERNILESKCLFCVVWVKQVRGELFGKGAQTRGLDAWERPVEGRARWRLLVPVPCFLFKLFGAKAKLGLENCQMRRAKQVEGEQVWERRANLRLCA
jgi:hypothetical protein